MAADLLPWDVVAKVQDTQCVARRLLDHLAEARGDRRALGDHLSTVLTLHDTAEQAVLYPEMAGCVDDQVATTARDGSRRVQELLTVMDLYEPSSDEFETALEQLRGEVNTHGAHELEWLGLLRRQLGTVRMVELGDAYTAVMSTATSRVRGLTTDPSGLLPPQMQEVVDTLATLAPTPLHYLKPRLARLQPTPRDAVRRLLESRGERPTPERVGGIRDIRVPVSEEGPIGSGGVLVRVYYPAGLPNGPLPVTVYIHGGGWVIADLDAYDASARAIANASRTIVASIDYRKAPEHPFPAAHDDVLEATRWIMANAHLFGGDPLRIVLAGESAGGNMAASTCLCLKAAGERLPACQVLIYPVTTAATDSDSMYDSADASPLGRATMSWYTEQLFKSSDFDATHRRFDLLHLPSSDLQGLPPTVLVTADRDPLRSQGEAFAERLAEASVPVAARRFDGTTHEFFGMGAVLDQARQAQRFVADQLAANLR